MARLSCAISRDNRHHHRGGRTRGNNEGGVVVDEPLEGDVKGERERVSWPGKVIDRVSPEGRNEE